MARPTARVLALLELLQGGGTHTVIGLAAELEVDERTVRRYVDHLRDLDVPVRSVRGRYGGYRLAAGFRMPPLMLTEDEALAVVLGLDMVAGTGAVSQNSATAAADKVRRVLPPRQADRLAALSAASTSADPPPPSAESASAASAAPSTAAPTGAGTMTDTLLTVADAARARRPVAFAYRSGAGRESARTLHPYGVVARGGRWFVVGADTDSGEVRTFRLDRMVLPRTVSGTFEVPEGFDPAAQVLTGITRARRRHAVRVLVDAPADLVLQRLPSGLADVSDTQDGGCRVAIQAESLDWVPGVLIGLRVPFRVEGPDQLRDELRAVAAGLLDAAG